MIMQNYSSGQKVVNVYFSEKTPRGQKADVTIVSKEVLGECCPQCHPSRKLSDHPPTFMYFFDKNVNYDTVSEIKIYYNNLVRGKQFEIFLKFYFFDYNCPWFSFKTFNLDH